LNPDKTEVLADQAVAAVVMMVVAKLAEGLPLHQGKEMLVALVETIAETIVAAAVVERGPLETMDKTAIAQGVMV
jgi:hypothetical protein